MSESTENTYTVVSRKNILIFWLRMIGWLAAGVAAPITTFAIKFGLFTEYGYQVTTDELGNVTGMNVALNGWGLVSVVLIAFACISILNEVIDAYSNKYSLAKQCLMGLKNRLVPLGVAIAACFLLKGVLDQVIFCLSTLAISQIVAIPLNPLPKWKSEKKGEEDYRDLLTSALDLLKSLKKKEDK